MSYSNGSIFIDVCTCVITYILYLVVKKMKGNKKNLETSQKSQNITQQTQIIALLFFFQLSFIIFK